MCVTCRYLCVCNVQGYVRFQEENGAKRAADGLSQKVESGGNPQICGADTELRVLEGRKLSAVWWASIRT